MIKARTFHIESIKILCLASAAVSLIIAVTAAAGTFLYSNETGFFFYTVLNFEIPYFKYDSTRILEAIWQLPALIYLKSSDSPTMQVGGQILLLSYLVPQFMSVLVSYLILRRRGKQELVIYQLLHWAITGFVSSLFVVNTATPGIAIFWPLFYFLMVQQERVKFRDTIMIAGALVGIVLSHESLIVLVALIAAISVRNRGKIGKVSSYCLLTIAVLGISAQLITTIRHVLYSPSHDFIDSLFIPFFHHVFRRMFLLISVGSVVVCVILSSKQFKYRRLISGFTCAAVLVFSLRMLLKDVPMGADIERAERAFVSIICFIFAVLCFVFGGRIDADPMRKTDAELRILFLIIFTTTCIGTVRDMQKWERIVERDSKTIAELPRGSCVTFADSQIYKVAMSAPSYLFWLKDRPVDVMYVHNYLRDNDRPDSHKYLCDEIVEKGTYGPVGPLLTKFRKPKFINFDRIKTVLYQN